MIKASNHILESWRNYSDKSVEIISKTNEEPHNTITPIARFKKQQV
jgi:UDPglucose--hexose-1-phosphate uridylyltransferase